MSDSGVTTEYSLQILIQFSNSSPTETHIINPSLFLPNTLQLSLLHLAAMHFQKKT